MSTFKLVVGISLAAVVVFGITMCNVNIKERTDRLYSEVDGCEVIGDAWIKATKSTGIHLIYKCPDGAIRIRPEQRD